MSKFKVGDKVRCIEGWTNLHCHDTHYRLHSGKSYRITSFSLDGRVLIKGHNTREDARWDERRFEKINPNPRKL